jgi:uncharacterized protein YfdQ (DUF2303 family)
VTNDATEIARLAVQAKTPQHLDDNLVVLPAEDGAAKVVDLRDYTGAPRRKTGSRVVRDIRSFLQYLDKHIEQASTELWADEPNSRVVAVIDAHREVGEDAGYEQHRITLDLVHTPEWKTWLESNGKKMTQEQFAEFLEANATDITDPDPATFLEVAQTLLGSVNADWKSAHRLANGQIDFGYKETVTARAGENGELQIPADFTIAIRPYLGSHRYGVKAHFRYRINQGAVTLFYQLDRPEAVLESAFKDTVEGLQYGLPEESIALDEAGEKLIVHPALPGVSPILFGLPGDARR